MLHEISHIRQSDRSLVKRWFTSRDMDLFVWFRRKMPVGFQLSFNIHGEKQAISWDLQRGFHLYRVNSGETRPFQYLYRYQTTPLLTGACNQDDLVSIRRNFLVASENIEVGLTDFIYARLMEYPSLSSKPHVSHIDHPALR